MWRQHNALNRADTGEGASVKIERQNGEKSDPCNLNVAFGGRRVYTPQSSECTQNGAE